MTEIAKRPGREPGLYRPPTPTTYAEPVDAELVPVTQARLVVPTTVPAPRAQLVRLPNNRATLTGTVAQVSAMINRLGQEGLLVRSGEFKPTGVPDQVLVNVQLTPPVQPHAYAAPTRRRLPTWAIVTIAGIVASLCAFVAWLIYQLVMTIVASPGTAIAIALGAFLLLGALGGIGGGKTFSGTFQGKIH